MQISLYENRFRNDPNVANFSSFEEFCTTLRASSTTGPCAVASCPGKNCTVKNTGALWSPGILKPGTTRSSENVSSVQALVFDLDDLTDAAVDAVEANLAPYQYLCHSTHSHRNDRRRLHIIFRLQAPVPVNNPEAWKASYITAAAALGCLPADGSFDDNCKDPSRMFFLPSSPAGAPVVWVDHPGAAVDFSKFTGAPTIHGTILPISVAATPPAVLADVLAGVRAVRRKFAARDTNDAKLVAGAAKNFLENRPLCDKSHWGKRSITIHALMGALAFKISTTTNPDFIVELFRVAVATMDCAPDGVDHTLRKLRASFVDGQNAKVALDEERAAVQLAVSKVLGNGTQAPEAPPAAWLDTLARDDKGNILRTTHNTITILDNAPDLQHAFRFNEVVKRIDTSQGIFADENNGTLELPLAAWFDRFGLNMSPESLVKHISRVARKNSFDPLREHLESLEHDGIDRLTNVLETHCGAYTIDPETGTDCRQYLRLIGPAFFISAVARAMKPGEKVDTALILESAQGMKKSSFFKLLSLGYFQDTKINLESKDAGLVCGTKWFVELAELSALKKHDPETIKSFISSSVDSLRAPYERNQEDFPRRAIFVGTVNPPPGGYFTDQTGNRRFWPVAVDECDLKKVAADLDQLWAEAVARYRSGELWYFDEKSTDAAIIRAHVAGRRQVTPLEDQIRGWFSIIKDPSKRPASVTAHQVAVDVLSLTPERINERTYTTIGGALKVLGFEQSRITMQGQRVRCYRTPDYLLAAAPIQTHTN